MKRHLPTTIGVLAAMLTTAVVSATSFTLTAVTYPERRTVKLPFSATPAAPYAIMEGKVDYRESQAEIELEFKNMKPAILFGGDITCYVVWAVSKDGTAENLGELWMPEPDGKLEFTTGRKSFAVMITAEPYSLVERPSDLVIFSNRNGEDKRAVNENFVLNDLAPAAEHEHESIRKLAWDSSVPLDVHQAEKAVELARRAGAESYSPLPFRDATIALSQARTLSAATKSKARIDYSRRATDRASEAIQVTYRKKQAEELQRQIEARRAEMQALDERAQAAEERSAEAAQRSAEAEQKAAQAQLALTQANAALLAAQSQQAAAEQAVATTQAELAQLAEEKQALVDEQARLNASMAGLRQEAEDLRAESQRLKAEREELSNRLQGALSEVAETRDSARGFIVNLPDILFDVNKATLKHEAQLVIAKLTGILLIMPELNLRIEGHTDSQGSDEYNQRLSEARADAVKTFLEANGINNRRMKAVGYGESRPVADNQTASGRQQNRRVELVISEGEIAEAEPEGGE